MNSIQLVLDTKAELGEGPSWDSRRKVLYWVDSTRQKLHLYNPAKQTHTVFDTGEYIGAVVPRKLGGIVMTLKHGFYAYDFKTGNMTFIGAAELDKPNNRFNDGKCDAAGRLWAGTTSHDSIPNVGALYCLDTDWSIKKVLKNVSVSNGIAWSPDNSKMYYIDSPTKKVMTYDYDLATGTIRNPRVAVSIPNSMVLPDGMTSDEEGMIWVALWNGSAVTRWNPKTGKLLEIVNVPTTLTTSCVFGGDDLRELYITSARIGLEEKILAKEPYAGGLFAVNTRARGIPTHAFGG